MEGFEQISKCYVLFYWELSNFEEISATAASHTKKIPDEKARAKQNKNKKKHKQTKTKNKQTTF